MLPTCHISPVEFGTHRPRRDATQGHSIEATPGFGEVKCAKLIFLSAAYRSQKYWAGISTVEGAKSSQACAQYAWRWIIQYHAVGYPIGCCLTGWLGVSLLDLVLWDVVSLKSISQVFIPREVVTHEQLGFLRAAVLSFRGKPVRTNHGAPAPSEVARLV